MVGVSCYRVPYDCISCEHPIWTTYLGRKSPWMRLYRAIYLTTEGAKLSSIYEAGSAALGQVNSTFGIDHEARDVELQPWWSLVISKPPRALLIHSCCWPLLIRQFSNDEVNLDRLFEVCRSTPASNPVKASDYRGPEWPDLQHPLLNPVIQGVGDATKKLSKIQRANKSPSSNISFGTDCFSLLPMEIRLEIATYLSTAGFLDLRLVSGAMALIFSLQSFWRTRFRVNGDRGFLVNLSDEPRKRNNWGAMYRCTAKIERLNIHLWGLRRQWRNNCWIRDRYLMTQALRDQNEAGNDLLVKLDWKEANAEIFCESIMFKRLEQPRDDIKCSCRPVTVSQTVLLHDLVTALDVFILNEGARTARTAEDRSHIIGFDLISADPKIPNITLGHRLPGSQVTISFNGRHLRGFIITTGNYGIRALRPLWSDGTVTSWIGDWEDDGTCMKLVLKDDVKAISAKFDYCKMVSLCIA